MNRRMTCALIKHEMFALLLPLVFIVLCFITIEVGLSRLGNSDPDAFPWIFWLLFGLVFGSGLIARERRLRTDLVLGTLPVAAWKTHAFRFLFRGTFLPALVLALMFLKLPMDQLFYMRTLPYRDYQFIEAIMAALAGFAIGAAVSAAVRRESLALGGGFLGVITAFVIMLTIFLVHPENNLVFSSTYDSIPWLEGILVIACLVAVIMAVRTRDPGSRREFGRMSIPILACFAVGGILMWVWPYYLLSAPLEKLGSITRMQSVPGSNEVILNGNARFGGRLGLYRVGETDSNRMTSVIYRFSPSRTGKYTAVLNPQRYLWKHGNRLQIFTLDGTETSVPHAGYLSYQQGRWSPDDAYYATMQLDGEFYTDSRGKDQRSKEIVFISPDPGTPTVTWEPETLDGRVPGVLFPVGWLNTEHLICCYMPEFTLGPCGPVEIWQVSPGTGSGHKIWTGDLCMPPFSEWQMKKRYVILNRDRNSVVLLKRESAEQNVQGWLTEIFLDGREPQIHRELPGTSEICPDQTDSKIAWQENSKLADGALVTDLIVYDLHTMDSKSFRLPRVSALIISPDGHYAATRVYDKFHPDFDRIILVNLTTGEKTTVLEAVSEMVWTDRNILAVLAYRGTELGYLDPITGEYKQRLKLPSRGGEI